MSTARAAVILAARARIAISFLETSLIFFLYRVVQTAVTPLVLLYAVVRCIRDRRYAQGFSERLGALPPQFQRTVRDSVWLHAVSVGEVLSSVQLIRALREEMPQAPFFISCTTLAGREAAQSKLGDLVDGVFYAPVDYVWAIRRVLRRIRPAVLVVLETEIWPNLWHEIRRAGCALVVVNARISDRALPSYRRWAWLFRSVLRLPDAILVQSPEQKKRYLQAGAADAKLEVAGNLKFDFDPDSAIIPEPVREWILRSASPLWIAGSTVAPEFAGDIDEDDAVIAAWKWLQGVRLLIAPRKPERFPVVAQKLRAAGVPFALRSKLPEDIDAPVLLLDSVGELAAAFRYADVVFMGGTLAHRGGHNILEPALFERPIIVGPHLENFAEIQSSFRARAGFVEIASRDQLGGAVLRILSDHQQAASLGRKAWELAAGEQGATQRAVHAIVEQRWHAIPRKVQYGPLVPFLWLLSKAWIAGGLLRRRLHPPRRLSRPIVSVGALAMGGSGKTPAVRTLVRAIVDLGYKPAVLTRGYRRASREPVTILAAGSDAPIELTGDEAQMILRDGTAALGIGADRFSVGLALQEQINPDAFVLDDGFQHTAVHRDVDLVVLDGLDPFAGGSVFPLGMLREPVSALSRAGVVVISRSEGRRFTGVIDVIHHVNPSARILLAETCVESWVDLRTRSSRPVSDLAGLQVLAFCGIGNPETFRTTLQSLGCIITRFQVFPDHHQYTEADLSGLRTEPDQHLITTEKDAVRLERLLSDHGPTVTYLRISMQIPNVHVIFTRP